MLSLIIAAVVAATPVPKDCTWDNPGADPYKLNPVVALNDYHLDPVVKARLATKMGMFQYDEIVDIDRDSVKGNKNEYTNLRDMHYGKGRVCHGEVKRSKWEPKSIQRGLVYCDADSKVCVIVPTICNNVSLIDMVPPKEPDDVVGEMDANPPAAGPVAGPVPEAPTAIASTPPTDTGCCDWIGGGGGGGTFGGGGGGGGGGGEGGGGGGGYPGCTHDCTPPPCDCTPPPVCPPPPVSTVDEAHPAAMFAAGSACMFAGLWFRRRKSIKS